MKAIFMFTLLFSWGTSRSQDSLLQRYNRSFSVLKETLEQPQKQSFKEMVFLVEKTFQRELDYDTFKENISFLVSVVRGYMNANRLHRYPYPDSTDFKINQAIYRILADSAAIQLSQNISFKTQPYKYDFGDFLGKKDWRQMFVTKLLSSRKGNCHSMPYLYKILADELQADCWLSLAPNHIYIKNRNWKSGWYNTELTNGTFPLDAWIMGSGYVSLEAVQNGIYMDTLSNQQAIALCVFDLAKGYEFQTKNYCDGFILKCCDLSLQYFPLNVQAMLLKAETLKHVYEKQKRNKHAEADNTYIQMEELYIRLYELGYREMPEKMYLQWLRGVQNEKTKPQTKK